MGDIITIPLSRGKRAVIDPEDYERVMRYRWSAFRPQRGGSWYAQAKIDVDGKRRTMSLHRFLMGDPPGVWVDHKNGNGLDCRRRNMREASPSESAVNKRYPRGAAPYRGLFRQHSGRWAAQIKSGRTKVYLGTFGTPEEAARAYDDAAARLHGEFARVNFPARGVA